MESFVFSFGPLKESLEIDQDNILTTIWPDLIIVLVSCCQLMGPKLKNRGIFFTTLSKFFPWWWRDRLSWRSSHTPCSRRRRCPRKDTPCCRGAVEGWTRVLGAAPTPESRQRGEDHLAILTRGSGGCPVSRTRRCFAPVGNFGIKYKNDIWSQNWLITLMYLVASTGSLVGYWWQTMGNVSPEQNCIGATMSWVMRRVGFCSCTSRDMYTKRPTGTIFLLAELFRCQWLSTKKSFLNGKYLTLYEYWIWSSVTQRICIATRLHKFVISRLQKQDYIPRCYFCT